jgi:glutamate racemase
LIGVFDSGSGGLTILQALKEEVPNCSYIYLGDHKNAPYGSRDAQQLYDLTTQNVAWLFGKGCHLVVLACNSASSILRRLQHEWLPVHYPDRRVLGIIVPTIEELTGAPWHEIFPDNNSVPMSVGIFGTEATVFSKMYPAEITKRTSRIQVIQQSCPKLVPMIEAGCPADQIGKAVREYVGALEAKFEGRPIDAVVLGCTHYALIADEFAHALGAAKQIVSQPHVVAQSFKAYLERHTKFAQSEGPSRVELYTTGDIAAANASALRFSRIGTEFGKARF